jgi:RNA polymerase sporulation-specific sigma factor
LRAEKVTRDELVENNLALVHACANRFRGKGIEYDDLFSAGCLGLVKASDGFDESRGFAFSTYAVPVILGEIRRLFRDGGTVKVSRSLKEKALKIQRIRDGLKNELGVEPAVNEIAAAAGLDAAEVSSLLCVNAPALSLTLDGDGEEKQFDIPVDSGEDEITNRLAVRQALDLLSEDDRRLIILRYFDGLSQTVTAGKLGISQVQVSRREKKILLEMRKILSR